MRSATKSMLLAGFVWLMFSPSSAYAIEQRKFAALDRAAKRMERAAAGGVSREKFGALAVDLAAELVAVQKTIQDDEDRRLLSLYAQAGLAYGDSLTLWREKVDRGTSRVSARSPNIAPLVSRYAIRIDKQSGAEWVDCDSAIRSIWAIASKSLREAEEAEHQRRLIEQVDEEFERSLRRVERPEPFEVSPGNWTCPRGYVIRRGICLSDEEIARIPKLEIGR